MGGGRQLVAQNNKASSFVNVRGIRVFAGEQQSEQGPGAGGRRRESEVQVWWMKRSPGTLAELRNDAIILGNAAGDRTRGMSLLESAGPGLWDWGLVAIGGDQPLRAVATATPWRGYCLLDMEPSLQRCCPRAPQLGLVHGMSSTANEVARAPLAAPGFPGPQG